MLLLDSEFEFLMSRSGGKGGQNVNKVNTRVTLQFHILNSKLLSDEQKSILSDKLMARLHGDGYIQISSQSERSQLGNKEKCIEKFYHIIHQALTPVKERKATKVPTSVRVQRLANKKHQSLLKEQRKKIIE